MEIETQITDARLNELLAYWESRRGKRPFPLRRELDPAEIPKLLPHLLLVEAVGDRWRYRLVGTEVERRFGCRMGGCYIDELMHGDYLKYMQSLYDRIRRTEAPVHTQSAYANGLFDTERLMLPLSRDGTALDMVLAGQVFRFSSAVDRATVLVTQDQFALVGK
jgi:hypothetical protein